MKPALTALIVLSLLFVLLTPRAQAEAAPGAGSMTLAQACRGDGMVDVGFRWKGVSTAAVRSYLDVSFLDNKWARGTYSSVGPIEPTASTVGAGGFLPNKYYFVRLNSQLSTGAWDTSVTYTFAVIDCTDPTNHTANLDEPKKTTTATKPAPDPLSIPKSATPSSGGNSSSNNGSSNSGGATNETDSTPPSSPGDSTSTQCADGATVYGGGAAACSNHGGVAR